MNRSGTPAVPPRSQTPACNAVFGAFLLEWESCTPRLRGARLCQQHTPPRKSAQGAFLQPPVLLHRFCLWQDFGALLFFCDSALHSLFLTKGMSQHSPIPGDPAAPTKHSPLPALGSTSSSSVGLDRVTFRIDWGGEGVINKKHSCFLQLGSVS